MRYILFLFRELWITHNFWEEVRKEILFLKKFLKILKILKLKFKFNRSLGQQIDNMSFSTLIAS